MQLRARDGRALLAGQASDTATDQEPVEAEVDPHSLALGSDLADALHEWAMVADAVHRNGQTDGSAAAQLISRRGRQLAGRLAAAMGRPVSYADPLTGEVVEVDVPPAEQPEPAPNQLVAWWARQQGQASTQAGRPRHGVVDERPPWNTGLTVSIVTAILLMLVVVTLSLALGAANRWLPLIANIVIAVGLAPSVWLARRAPVWRWVAYGVVAGILVAWVALLFTAL
ncbi:MAG TPA: DUF2537 domain-containing protein [Pseudonocardiaceae bacterium]|nr:DUF2537 domain-containing protein [Pseudonocardiaceae bacterium]